MKEGRIKTVVDLQEFFEDHKFSKNCFVHKKIVNEWFLENIDFGAYDMVPTKVVFRPINKKVYEAYLAVR